MCNNIALSLQNDDNDNNDYVVVSVIFLPMYLSAATCCEPFPLLSYRDISVQSISTSRSPDVRPPICPLYLFICTLERIAITAAASYVLIYVRTIDLFRRCLFTCARIFIQLPSRCDKRTAGLRDRCYYTGIDISVVVNRSGTVLKRRASR